MGARLPHDVRLAVARAIGKSANIENHMVRADMVYDALCEALAADRLAREAVEGRGPLEQFGHASPEEEAAVQLPADCEWPSE